MSTLFTVNVDSFSDVITNSSTDIFACKSQKSVEAIQKLLDKLARTADLKDSGATVEEMTLREFWLRVSDWAKFDMGYDYDFHIKTRIGKGGYWKDKSGKTVDDHEMFEEWMKRRIYLFGEDVTPETKVIVIEGKDDNSIPYWLQEFIEQELGGLRYHLG